MTDQRTDTPSLQFVARGVPQPQSGMKPGGRTRTGTMRLISTGGAHLADWRGTVTAAALAAKLEQRHPGFDEPITVIAAFRFPMPKSRPKWMRTEGEWPKSTKPDLDKLQRALGDSLSAAGVITDDNLIVRWDAQKNEVWQQWTGVVVLIKPAPTYNEEDQG